MLESNPNPCCHQIFITEIEAGIEIFSPGDSVPFTEGHPFKLVFTNFGMTAVVSERLESAMRAGATKLGAQDAQKIIQANVMSGALKTGDDLRRLKRTHQECLQNGFWGGVFIKLS
jgi:hypothetical protein